MQNVDNDIDHQSHVSTLTCQMAQSIPDGHLPPLDPISDVEMKKLERLDRLVGVANDDWGKVGGLAVKADDVKLARSASGIVRRKHASEEEKRQEQDEEGRSWDTRKWKYGVIGALHTPDTTLDNSTVDPNPLYARMLERLLRRRHTLHCPV
jgi:hypothetical protein